jgi:hypothetical protein
VVNWISDQVNFWSGNGQKPGETAELAQARDVTRAVVGTGLRVADAYYTGGVAGSFGRNVVAPRATVASPTTRNQGIRSGGQQFARDAAVAAGSAAAGYGIGRGVVAGARRAFPSRVTEIGVHVGGNEIPIGGRITYDASRANTGFAATDEADLVVGQTYKWSGTNAQNKPVSAADIVDEIYRGYADDPRWHYVTRSRVGRVDPEIVTPSGIRDLEIRKSLPRITQSQKVVDRIDSYEDAYGSDLYSRLGNAIKLEGSIVRQRAILAAEQARTAGRAGVAGARTTAAGQTTFVQNNGRRRNVR